LADGGQAAVEANLLSATLRGLLEKREPDDSQDHHQSHQSCFEAK
jgi:hypothetical protein